MKNKRISWAGYNIWKIRDQTIREATKWIPNGKKQLGRPRQKWIDRVKIDLQMIEVK